MDSYRDDRLERERCMLLLGSMGTGRVVYTAEALPAVIPVRFSMAGDESLLLTADWSTALLRAADRNVIAFETGEIDPADGRGWSVTVVGRSEVLTPAETPTPAGAENAAMWFRLPTEFVVGRVLGWSPGAAPSGGPAAPPPMAGPRPLSPPD
ncbi:pyridoxamine 5'-phosphate oxidase family protein [Streptomyces sp. NPDC101225]|uniref:pyridoxamine 5'-phosphate oxidase family protein n=1 Tax=Streptomyces sp. NPDC101225 TaxID=3366135 RepID=UPI00381BF06D